MSWEVCGAGPDPLRPPSIHSAPTVLSRARRGVPGQASCVSAVPVFSSGVLTRDYRAHGTVAPRAGGGRAVLPQGVTSALFLFINCLPILCMPARTAIACDRTVDRPVLSFIPNHHGPGVPVVGTTRLPIGCRYTKCFSSSPPR